MRGTILTASLLVFLGCGGSLNTGPQYIFTGMWKGTMTNKSTVCSDGSTYPADSAQVTFTIRDLGSGGQLGWETNCGNIIMTQHENLAVQTGASHCATISSSGAFIDRSIIDTSMLLLNDTLQLDSTVDVAISFGGKSTSCKNIHLTGTLIR